MKLPPLPVCCLLGISWGCAGVLAQTGGPGYALSFNSANKQNLQVAANANLTPSQLTIEAWVNVASAVCGTILSRGDGSTGATTDYIFQIGNNGTTCETRLSLFGVNAWDSSTSAIPLGTWTHVAVTFDGANKQFYINGVLDRTAPRNGSLFHSTTAMFIGVQGATCFCTPFNGTIDELRLWNTVRTQAQIQQNMRLSLTGTEAGLVAYYRMNEGSGLTTADATGHGYTANMGGGSQAPGWVLAGESMGNPVVTTLAANTVTNPTAVLNGTVNPEAQTTGAWFQWGTNSNFGNTTSI